MAHPYQNPPHPQMANLPPLQPPQRPYSPYQQSPPAMSPNGIPPAKRQRLSPQPQPPTSPYANSPYATPYPPSPAGQYLSLPGTPVTPHAPLPFNQPQPIYHQNDMNARPQPQHQGTMGPPQVPYSKANDKNASLDKPERSTDLNDLSDLVTAAGINLREEEDYMAKNYRNQHGPSFNNSFNSQSSSTVSPNNSFGQWQQGHPGGYGAFQGTGPLSQSYPQGVVEEDVKTKHEKAARALSEAQQYHLHDPFVNPNNVRRKLVNRTYENGVKIDIDGLYDKISSNPQNVNRREMRGPDGTITVLQADSLLNKSAPLVDVITLISLAAQERLRTVLEDAYSLCRGRQIGSNGVVPPQWSDIAVGTADPQPTTAVPQNLTKTAWEHVPDSAISPMTVPGIKREPDLGAARLPTPPTDTPPTPQPTVAFPNQIANSLKRTAARDRKFEEERVAKRQKRMQKSASADSPAAGIPNPIMSIPEKMTKKERDRLNKIGQSEEVLHRNTNQTASMQLGLGKKTYSWMTGGGKSGAATPSRINTSVGGAGGARAGGGAGGGTDAGLRARERQFGSFKEDGPKGRNIQIRDFVHALDLDGKERKTLMTALARLKSTEV